MANLGERPVGGVVARDGMDEYLGMGVLYIGVTYEFA